MSLKLMLAVLAAYCVAVAFAPPPPPVPPLPEFVERDVNKQEETAQRVCDDTCLLCGLVLNYKYPDQSVQTSKKESNLNQFMSAIQLLSGRIQRGKRQAIPTVTEESCLDVCSMCSSSVMRQKRNVNRLASAEQIICDDPCTLCGLLLEYISEELGDYPAAKQQKSFNEQSKLGEKILSLAKIKPPPKARKREAVVSEDFLSLARPTIGKREAVVSEDTCIDVCGECSAAKEKKAREQTMINSILEMLLSQ